ncbi:MAG: SDR family oxidoreductase [Candidatus Eremiobacteraeota bacterium]|nr:SDR family oxidoreductase [Candidatus Eremiobacteraeota bacterium]
MSRKRSILITGAAAGIPRGIAGSFAASGDGVTITYRPGGTPPDETLALVRAHDSAARAYPIDFLDVGALEASLRDAVRESGPFDVLVHGVGPMVVRRFERATFEDYRAMLDGNLTSAVIAAGAVLPGMRERAFGRLIFFGMNGSEVTRGVRGLTFHAAAKSGLVAFAKSLALEEGRYGITVNVVEPGDIRDKTRDRAAALRESAPNPRGRPGSWEDIADAVRFLASDASDFINGAVLAVTGGLSEPYERTAKPS